MIDFANGTFSQKSLDFIANANARLNIAHGAVRSSKTVSCTLRWITFCAQGPPGDLLMSGKTVATLQRNVLNDVFDLVGEKNYRWVNRQQGEIRLLERRVHLVGASSEDAEGKIRGSTLAGAYCDEASTYPRSFWDMLMTRLSVEGAECFANCNPDDPDHWFHKHVICNEKITNKKIWHFTLDDNPNLPAEYRESLEQSFSGVFHDRMIKGLWVVAEGIIYRTFAENLGDFVVKKIPPGILFGIISIDFGGNGSGHAYNFTGFGSALRTVCTIDDAWTNKEFDANDLAADFLKFVQKQIARKIPIREIRADGEATVLVRTIRNTLKKAGINIPIKNAIKGSIWDRIQFYTLLMGTRSYFICEWCEHTIHAFKNAKWHLKKPNERLDDNTTNIDNIDAQEYATEPYQKQMMDTMLLLGGMQSGRRGNPDLAKGSRL